MTRRTGSIVLGALAVLAMASPASAQSFFFGGGGTLPMGDYKTYAKTGWMMTAGVTIDIGSKGLFFDAEGFFGSNSHKDTGNDKEKTNLAAGIAALGYTFGAQGQKVRPYVLAGAGILNNQFRTDSDANQGLERSTKSLGITAAGGVVLELNEKANFWVEGRYLKGTGDNSGTTVIPILVGISIKFGK